MEEVTAAALGFDEDELEGWIGDADGESGEAAAGADVGDAGGRALGQEAGVAEGGEEGERFAEEPVGDGGGFGDGGEASAVVPFAEQGVVAGEALALGGIERKSEAIGLFVECGEQLGGGLFVGGRR